MHKRGTLLLKRRRLERCFSIDSIQGWIDGPSFQLGTGKIGNQAHQTVIGTAGNTVVFCSAVKNPGSFLTVDYRQRYHGVGVIPPNKGRGDSGKPSNIEILRGRAIDRALRPFVSGYHLQASVQSYDPWSENSGHPVSLAIHAAAAALDVPVAAVTVCLTQEGEIRQDPTPRQSKDSLGELLYVGTPDGNTVTMEWIGQESLPEHLMMELIDHCHNSLKHNLEKAIQKPKVETEDSLLRSSLGLPPVEGFKETDPAPDLQSLVEQVKEECSESIGDSILRFFGYSTAGPKATGMSALIHSGPPILSKRARGLREQIIIDEIIKVTSRVLDSSRNESLQLSAEDEAYIHERVQKDLLQKALDECVSVFGDRSDKRGSTGDGWKTIRPIQVQVPALPQNVHGSALFSRGDTQVLTTATLGPPKDGLPQGDPYLATVDPREPKQEKSSSYYDTLPVGSLRFLRTQEALVSDLNSEKSVAENEPASGYMVDYQRFFLQYDFPSYSTGTLSTGKADRRSIGHGALAERAIYPMIPKDFPYAVRLTSEVTDSNGSSSMASICGASLALMDAGVPIQKAVAGISVGLTANGSENGLMLDITGTEDHYGVMDFKVGGCRDGVTAFQLDVKQPVSRKVVAQALQLAKAGRVAILDEMDKCISDARRTRKLSAPCVEVVSLDPARKRDLLGPGGVILRQLEDRYAVSVDLSDPEKCLLFGANHELVQKARQTVMELVADVKVGEVYEGTVIEVKDFGAIVELLRNKEGLLHVSELTDEAELDHADGLLGFAREHLRVGQKLDVLCIGVDSVQGSIKLSRKALLNKRSRNE